MARRRRIWCGSGCIRGREEEKEGEEEEGEDAGATVEEDGMGASSAPAGANAFTVLLGKRPHPQSAAGGGGSSSGSSAGRGGNSQRVPVGGRGNKKGKPSPEERAETAKLLSTAADFPTTRTVYTELQKMQGEFLRPNSIPAARRHSL